jgi:exonuclease III/ribonuclease HI
MHKLPRIVARCAELELDAVALQEIGDPALLSNRFPPYQLVYAAGPSHHQAGVGLLLPLRLAPSVRRYMRSQSGRLIGAVLELSKGHQLLLVSAYMPSGLDHQAPSSEQHDAARALYAELLGWAAGMQQVIVLGDLNETLTQWDRQPLSAPRAAAAAVASPLHTLQVEGFTDVFRQLHFDASLTPGFTHLIDGARPSRSRIDYIWTKDVAFGSLLRCEVDNSLRSLSHHRLLWAEISQQKSPAVACPTPLLELRLPNLRAANDERKDKFIQCVNHYISARQAALDDLALGHSTDSLQCLAVTLTDLLRRAAAKSFPITGAAPMRSTCALQLQKQRRCLSRLLAHSEKVLASAKHRGVVPHDCLVRNPEWRRQMSHCRHSFSDLQWHSDAWSGGPPHVWLQETRVMLNRIRSAIRKEQRRMLRDPPAASFESSAAHVHRLLKSDALPSHLHSVVNVQGELTSTAEELESVMVEHFSNVFAMPQPDPTPLPHPPPATLFDKESVQAEWFDGLMAPVNAQEITAALADAHLVSSPGEDGVSTGLWKLALQGSESLRSLVSSLFTGCLDHSFFPSAWKTSVIVPLVKDEKKDRTMSNVRPISLQSCLGKLFMKVLAHRLGSIFARFPILNPAQRGFIHGGSITKCIDELLDAWDHGRSVKSELYTLFYDIAQAYDSVQRGVLVRAMRRLRMPGSFVELVADSLTGLSSCVRTAYGVSRRFDVQRSLRQGCPLAPLLFVVLMDALHDGLEVNPFSGARAGLVLPLRPSVDLQISSLGYADDTNILANNLANLRILNDWVHYFLRFNSLRLNHGKCELVGRDAAGLPVTAAAIVAAGITIEGHAITPVAHDAPIRYLGVHCRFDGDWSAQHHKSTAMVQLFSRVVSKFKLSVRQASYMFSTFLLPKLELALRYITGPHVNQWIKQYDAVLVGSIKHAIGSPLSLSHSAVALTAGFLLPSWLEVAVKVSELFIRLNTVELDDRWSRFGRILMLSRAGSVTGKRNLVNKDSDSGCRFQRAAAHAVNQLQWSMQLREELIRGAARVHKQHLFNRSPAGLLLSSDECSSSELLALSDGNAKLSHDCWTGWGAAAPPLPQHVHIYTDGSHDPHSVPKPTSSWAFAVRDQWLDDNFARLPVDEQHLNAAVVGGATLIGSSISATFGIYPAELQAIARALATFPLSCSLHIHSDSQSAIAGIRAYSSEINSRQRLRMASRPLLQLIHHQLEQRKKAGGTVELEHVRAHSAAADIHSVGNRLADYKANTTRARPQTATPVTLKELPLDECEHRLTVWTELGNGAQLIDDVRRSAIAQLKARQLERWRNTPPSDTMDGAFACSALLDSSRVVLTQSSPSQQAAFMHIATNSIQCCWQQSADGSSRQVKPLWCASCNVALTLTHLTECADNAVFRLNQRVAVLTLLSSYSWTQPWLDGRRQLSLTELLAQLFPQPPDTPMHLHITRIMCGVFSARQANAALKSLDCPRTQDGLKLMLELRLCCVDGVQSFFQALKNALP